MRQTGAMPAYQVPARADYDIDQVSFRARLCACRYAAVGYWPYTSRPKFYYATLIEVLLRFYWVFGDSGPGTLLPNPTPAPSPWIYIASLFPRRAVNVPQGECSTVRGEWEGKGKGGDGMVVGRVRGD